MSRSHPPTLITIARRAIQDEIGVSRGERVLLAISGGADSMSLLSVLARLAKQLGFSVAAHGVDHGLRSEARTELDLAQTFAGSLGVPFSRSQLAVPQGGNLQARARDARKAALRSRAAEIGADWIATAHHADDRAETVLMRLLRGTSPAGLGVLPPRAQIWIRPLIRACKSDIVAHVRRHRVPFVDDPSNQDLRFLRVRVRRELMPVLKQLSPRIVPHLNALADEILMSVSVGARGSADEPLLELGLSPLGTAQRFALRSMLEQRSRSARVRLKGGKELHLDARTGALVVGDPTRRGEGR